MKHIIILIILITFGIAPAFPQQPNGQAYTWEDFVSIMADETDDDTSPDTELFEELYELHTHPFNLNNCSEDDFRQLPFLTDNEIKDIMYYISVHKKLMSTGELMFIYSLSQQKRLMLQLFCYAGETDSKNYSLRNLPRYSDNELTIRTDVPLYTKAGYASLPDSIILRNPNKVYQGNRLFHSLRYTFSSQRHFFAGLQLEKDAGERYIDHFAGYAMIKDIGHIHTAVLGNYRISFGHGLVINTGSSFGKAMKMNSLEIIDRGITRHSSTTEAGYLTGGAATLRYSHIKLSAYASYRNADATFNNDSSGISTLKTDGLHRTQLEISKKGNIHIMDIGANIHFDLNQLQLSLTAATTHLSEPLSPKYDTKSTQYRYYNPRGSDFSAASIAYSYRGSKLTLSGETALSANLALATIDQMQWMPNSFNTISAIYRYYQARYNALNARSFGENSNVRNEQGIYLGWNSQLSRSLTLSAYLDLMYFPWLKYQVYGSSYGYEGLAQLQYTITPSQSLSIRYRAKSKEKDYSAPETADDTDILKFKTSQNLRLQHTISSPSFTFRTSISGTYTTFGSNKSRGYSISEAIRYTGVKKLRLDFAATYFDTDDYDSRLYSYEPSLLYTFAMTPYYYKGVRTIFLTNWNPIARLHLTIKLSCTKYLNRDNIGTALELINANHREDIQLQLRWRF